MAPAVNDLHAALGPFLMVLVAALAVAALVAVALDRAPALLDGARRVLLGLVVAQAAIGLALAARGPGPSELLHWVYGLVIVLALLVPGMLRLELPAGRRAAALAIGSVLAVVIAWRLGASG